MSPVVKASKTPVGILGRKVGMSRFFMEDGANVPVTVIQAGPCYVTEIKTQAKHGYSAIQLAFEDVKPERSTMPVIGHDAKAGVSPKRFHREVRLEADPVDVQLGQEITVAAFEDVPYVDVIGRNKGKGFQGTMKRHNFKGNFATHGTERKHRSPGSIAAHATNRGYSGKLKKGKRMAGHLGDVRVTCRNLDVVQVIADKNILLVKGTVPGGNDSVVFVRSAIRMGRKKQLKAAAKTKGK